MRSSRVLARDVRAFAVLVALTAPASAPSQSVQSRTLAPKPDAEFAEPFTALAAVRELSDGRLIVIDAQDKTAQLVDATLKTAQKVGRQGSGPGEYQMPFQLLPAPADTTLLFDLMGARFVVIDRSGKAVNTISLVTLGPPGVPIGPTSVKGEDAQGRLLYQGLNFSLGPAGPVFGDSAPVLRYAFSTKKVDTLAWARTVAPKMQLGQGAAGRASSVRVGPPAFPVVDEWGLLPDGRVVILRGKDYRVDFVDGAKTTTARVAYEPVKVTDADKEEYRETLKKTQEAMRKAMGDAAASRGLPANTPMPSLQVDEPSEWPAVKPPFTQGALLIAPNGQVWVSRLGVARAKTSTWDVLDRTGKLVYRFTLPEKHKLVGIGAHALYVVRIDEDDLQYLQRYKN
jgi:hypothetical protein